MDSLTRPMLLRLSFAYQSSGDLAEMYLMLQ